MHRRRAGRSLLGPAALLIAGAIAAAACTPGEDSLPTTSGAEPEPVTTSTTVPSAEPRMPSAGSETPPPLPDPADVAASHLRIPAGYVETDEADLFSTDARFAIGRWLPNALVAGTADHVVERDGKTVLAVSVIPNMQWRGDPTLVPALADLEGAGLEVDPSVFRTSTTSGLDLFLWSTGDGFIVTAALDEDEARRYLTALESTRTPLPAWEAGACLYVDPSQQLPWAPFPMDAIVPCEGPHNAEVIASTTTLAGFEAFDDELVAYERNYRCDRAFEEAMGPQRDHQATLITYMPDEDEFERGDRYLACVIQLDTPEGPAVVSGRITERTDLAWRPTVGECFGEDLAPEPIDCSDLHSYELVVEVEYQVDTWPQDARDAFRDACVPGLDALVEGPAEIEVFGMGLYPFAFERGERSIRCMAFVRGSTGLGRVLGSFTETWRLLGEGGVAA